MKQLSILLGIVVLVSPVFAGDPKDFENRLTRLDKLIRARSLKCTFGPGASARWETGEPKISLDQFDITYLFDSIDLKSGKARFLGNQGAGDVMVYPTPAGITFIEETGSGNLAFTTVFSTLIKGTDEFVGVTSRHMDFFGHLLPSQYQGTCKIWDLIP